MVMWNTGEMPPLPETLQRIVMLSTREEHSHSNELTVHAKNIEPQADSLPSVSQLLTLVRDLRGQYTQLVVELSAMSEQTTSADASTIVQERLEALARRIVELQRGIRSKNTQCVRLALRASLVNEVEARRRALSRMETALSIAKQSV